MNDTLTVTGVALMCIGVLVSLVGEMPLMNNAANQQPIDWAWSLSLWAAGALVTSLGTLLVARNSEEADTPGEKLLDFYRGQHPYRQLTPVERGLIPVAGGLGLILLAACTIAIGITAGGGKVTNFAAILAAICANVGIAIIAEVLAGLRPERAWIPTHLWILSAAAVLTGGEFESFNTKGDIEELRDSFTRWWGIRDVEDFWPIYQGLLKGLHEQSFREYLARVDHDRQHTEASGPQDQRYEYVEQFGDRIRKHGIIGWDHGRAIAVPKWCAELGYLRVDEAWKLMFDAALLLQQEFSSWEEYAESFLSGMVFWNPEQAAEYAEWSNWLRNSLDSPWNAIPWNTQLDPEVSPPVMPPWKTSAS